MVIVWQPEHTWDNEVITDELLQRIEDNTGHLKQRSDRQVTYGDDDADPAAVGDVLVATNLGTDNVTLSSVEGQAGPFAVALEPMSDGNTGQWVRWAGTCNINVVDVVNVANWLRTSATKGKAEMCDPGDPGAFAFAVSGNADPSGQVAAILLNAGGAAGGGGGSGGGTELWDPFGVAVPPVASDLSVHDNWSGSGILTTLTQEGSAVAFKNPCSGSTVERGAFGITSAGPYSVPTTGPFTATACFWLNSPIVQNGKASLTLRQSGNDKRIQAGLYLETGTDAAGAPGLRIDGANWTDFDSFSSGFGTFRWPWGGGPIWLRIRDDNTNCYWEVSRDGQYFQAYSSGGTRSFCTPDQAGITMESFGNGSGATMSMMLLSLEVLNTA